MPPIRLLVVGLLLAAAALGGCLGDEPGTSGPGNTTTTRPSGSAGSTTTGGPPAGPPVVDLLLGFGLEGCRGVSVRQAVPLADAQALLPAGFTARSSGLADGAASLVLDLYGCGNLTARSARVPDTVYGQLSTFVEPPTERVPGTPSAEVHEYVFRVLAGDDVLAALWPAAGYETRSGPAEVSVGALGQDLLELGLRMAEAAVGDQYEASAVASTAVAGPMTGSFARYTALADGSVLVWTGTYDFGGGWTGQGTFRVPADDAFHGASLDGQLQGIAIVHGSGAMANMDLRRVFTPP